MSHSIDSLKSLILDSGLLSDKSVSHLESLSAADSYDQFLEGLNKEKLLTKFQLDRILADKNEPLILGNYVLLDKIGAGGMGEVYLAKHQRMDRLVALKVLPEEFIEKADSLERFQREVKAAARLSHPNIVTAHDADEFEKTHFLVMEYVDGQDLSGLVKKQGTVSVDQAIELIYQAAQGLAYAHAQGVIHRDIKPSNLLLSSEGVVKILDMGLARIENNEEENLDEATALTQSGAIMGTVDYMSPEQWLDPRTAAEPSDIYSLGCAFYFLLTGRPLFSADTIMKRFIAKQNNEPPSLKERVSELPNGVEAIYQKMVARNVESRYQDFNHVITALEPYRTLKSNVESATNLQFSLEANEEDVSGDEPTVQHDSASAGFAATISSENIEEQESLKQQFSSKSSSSKKWIFAVAGIIAVLTLSPLLYFAFTGNAPTETTVNQTPTQNSNITIPQVDQSVEPDNRSKTLNHPPSTSKYPNPYLLQFAKENSQIVTPIKLTGDEPITIECWVTSDASLFTKRNQHSVLWNLHAKQSFSYDIFKYFRFRSPDNEWIDNHYSLEECPHHIAFTFDGEAIQLWLDGEPKGKPVAAKTISALEPTNNTVNLVFGNPYPSGASSFPGTIDEIRISSSAIYTDSFEPERRLTEDDNTLALYHCDEGEGETLADASKNNNHAKLVNQMRWLTPEEDPGIPKEVGQWASEEGPLDLIGIIQPRHISPSANKVQIEEGEMHYQNGAIDTSGPTCHFPVGLPKDYDLVAEFTRTGSRNAILFAIPVYHEAATWELMLDAYSTYSAINFRDGSSHRLKSQPTHKLSHLKEGERNRLEIKVRHIDDVIHVKAILNDENIVDWQDNKTPNMDQPSEELVEFDNLERFSIHAHSDFTIHKVECTPVSGPIKLLDWGTPAQGSDGSEEEQQ